MKTVRYYKGMNICQNSACNKKFTPKHNTKGLYCSHSCSATVSNTNNPKRKRTVLPCVMCGSLKKTKAKQKYCSNTCQQKYQGKIIVEQWLEGKLNGSQKDGTISRYIRNYLLEKQNFSCLLCGWNKPNPITNLTILTIDHIDGDIGNGFVDNIQLICWNCHTLTPTFGSLNKGKGKRNTIGMRQMAALRELESRSSP